VVGQNVPWEKLDSWLTPNDQFFTVAHYDKPLSTQRPGGSRSAGWCSSP
jgi:hypothetical protein